MAIRRLTLVDTESFYHCISRTTNGDFLFDETARVVFQKMLHRIAEFTGVEVLTYCILSNHFHLLLRVPPESTEVSDEELLRRYRTLYSQPSKFELIRPARLQAMMENQESEFEKYRKIILGRMHSLPKFMQLLKQRFSVWFNQKHKRFGTLWAHRYTSIAVEGKGNPLLTMATYIDLNPIRAGMVTKPESYPFSGIGEPPSNRHSRTFRIHRLLHFCGKLHPPETAWEFYRSTLESILEDPRRSAHPLLRRNPHLSQSTTVGAFPFVSQTMANASHAFRRSQSRRGPSPIDAPLHNPESKPLFGSDKLSRPRNHENRPQSDKMD